MLSNLNHVSTQQRRLAELAKRSPELAFTSLAHLIDIEWLREAYRRTRKDGAAGIDGQTAQAYAAQLETNLQSLLARFRSGTYRAPPVRRVWIPKGSGNETRPIGIPTFEDKVLQRAVLMLLEPIFEMDFDAGSYGFRPGRSTHQAIAAMWKHTMDVRGGWVLEVDLRKFFDTLDHGHLRAFLQRRVRDGVLTRLIGKWLQAGVLEAGQVSHPDAGSPQGGVISPLLANIYLHYVLDEWFQQVVHGERAQDGNRSVNIAPAFAPMVSAAHRSRAGRRPRHGRAPAKCSHFAHRLRSAKCSHFFGVAGSRRTSDR